MYTQMKDFGLTLMQALNKFPSPQNLFSFSVFTSTRFVKSGSFNLPGVPKSIMG